MSWSLKRKAQALLASEDGAVRKDWGGRIAIASQPRCPGATPHRPRPHPALALGAAPAVLRRGT